MIVIVGLIVLIAAVIIGITGVLANGGRGHPLTGNFAVFGYHVTGSVAVLFLCGIVVGAVGMAGLSLLLAGHRRTARRGMTARRELRVSRRATVAAGRDQDERARGSRHIRTNPSWRDMLERRSADRPMVGVLPSVATKTDPTE